MTGGVIMDAALSGGVGCRFGDFAADVGIEAGVNGCIDEPRFVLTSINIEPLSSVSKPLRKA